MSRKGKQNVPMASSLTFSWKTLRLLYCPMAHKTIRQKHKIFKKKETIACNRERTVFERRKFSEKLHPFHNYVNKNVFYPYFLFFFLFFLLLSLLAKRFANQLHAKMEKQRKNCNSAAKKKKFFLSFPSPFLFKKKNPNFKMFSGKTHT